MGTSISFESGIVFEFWEAKTLESGIVFELQEAKTLESGIVLIFSIKGYLTFGNEWIKE